MAYREKAAPTNDAPTAGEEMERIVADAYAQPDAIVQKVRKALMDW